MRSALENCGWQVVSVKMPSLAMASLSDGTGSNTETSPGTVMCRPCTWEYSACSLSCCSELKHPTAAPPPPQSAAHGRSLRWFVSPPRWHRKSPASLNHSTEIPCPRGDPKQRNCLPHLASGYLHSARVRAAGHCRRCLQQSRTENLRRKPGCTSEQKLRRASG